MNPSKIFAHRGVWYDIGEQNSSVSFVRAFEAGFGIETDIRDSGGEIVISHDIPKLGFELTLRRFLLLAESYKWRGHLALNIKSDGLLTLLNEVFDEFPTYMDRLFLFDMSIPEHVKYTSSSVFNLYQRVSEIESGLNENYLRSSGYWVDNFSGEFDQLNFVKNSMFHHRNYCLVSPELHGRSYLEFWKELLSFSIVDDHGFGICTDHAEAFAQFVKEKF